MPKVESASVTIRLIRPMEENFRIMMGEENPNILNFELAGQKVILFCRNVLE
ncbi:hypothetical protein RV07_GL003569 [Enterococcus malodoratus]|nr:hypothetical protein RV07_GL003569 [Enterococcus malodoratus]